MSIKRTHIDFLGSRSEETLSKKFLLFYTVVNNVKINLIQAKVDEFLDLFIYGEINIDSNEFVEFMKELEIQIIDVLSQIHVMEDSFAELKRSAGLIKLKR